MHNPSERTDIDKLRLEISQIDKLGNHFEIGKLHAGTYYYTKKFFQNTDNALLIAKLLKEKIKSTGLSLDNTTLVGYGSHSGLFLRNILDLTPAEEDCNFVLLDKSENDFIFLFQPELKDNILIILPVTCTFNTCFHIKKFLEDYIEKECRQQKNIHEVFFTVLIITDPNLELTPSLTKKILIDDLTDEHVRELYKRYQWNSVDAEKIVFKASMAGTFEAYYLLQLPSELQLAEKCDLCFPVINSRNEPDNVVDQEAPLLLTRLNHDIPNFILGLPAFHDKKQETAGKSFNEVFRKRGVTHFPHLYGHLKIHNTNFLNYIQSDIFYTQNKTNIQQYFSDKLAFILDNNKKTCKVKNLVIITPGHFRNPIFLEDLIMSNAFTERNGDEPITVSIIPYQTFIDTHENFVNIHGEQIRQADCLLYYDDVISGGQQFALISHHVKSMLADTPDEEVSARGFDAVIALIDRTTESSKTEILRKLAHPGNKQARHCFFAFFKLNIPVIELKQQGDPITERKNLLRQIFDECHLDALKFFVGEELIKGNPQTLSEMVKAYADTQLKHFPFTKDKKTFNLYRQKYTYPVRNLIKLEVHHDISTWFANQERFDKTDLQRLFAELTSDEKCGQYFQIDAPDSPGRDIDTERQLISDIIVRTLSGTPFKRYKDIYEAIFDHNNCRLKEIFSRFAASDNKKQPTFSDFLKLRFHIRRSIDLNSNFIISYNFLYKTKLSFRSEAEILKDHAEQARKLQETSSHLNDAKLKNLAYRVEKVNSYKYFLLYCYKELIFKNPARSIILEQLQNNPALLPLGLGETLPGTTLEEVITDPFYQLGRVLKSENIHPLNELKGLYMRDNEIEKGIEEKIRTIVRDYSNKEAMPAVRSFMEKNTRYEKWQLREIHRICMDTDIPDELCLRQIKRILKHQDAPNADEQERAFKEYAQQKYLNPENSQDIIITMANVFISKSKHHASESGFADIHNAVLSMLYTISLLKNTRKPKHVESPGKMEEIFHDEIKKILDAACSIIGAGLKYYFFIEYRDGEDDKDVSNIYPISSDPQEMQDNTDIRLPADGLIYSMLHGLKDYEGGNIQTFIALAKEGERVFSFKPNYYRGSTRGNTNLVNVEKTFGKDCQSAETGLKGLEKANMVLLFRLAVTGLDTEGAQLIHKGQAVFAICSEATASIENYVNFVNVEKVRLLLLIKEQLLDYLQKKFDNDAFIEVLEGREFKKYQRKLKHGIPKYISDMCKYAEAAARGEAAPKQLKMHSIIGKAIVGQINHDNIGYSRDKKEYSRQEVLEQLSYLFEDKVIGGNSIPFSQIDCRLACGEQGVICMQPVIFDVVLVEMILNIKKNCPMLGPTGITISFENDCFTFRNIRNSPAAPKCSPYGGINMCQQILETLGLAKESLKYDIEDNCFIVTINLTLNQSHGTGNSEKNSFAGK